MSNILVVIGSARTGRVSGKTAEYVKSEIESRGDTAIIADLKEINLPFYAHELAPAQPEYTPTDENVIAWGKMVSEADGVVLITPEYNHTITAIEKNALDSLLPEWTDKPVTVVAHGWSGGTLAVQTLDEVLPHLKTKYDPNATAKLAFMKDLNPDGSIIDETSVTAQISTALDSIK